MKAKFVCFGPTGIFLCKVTEAAAFGHKRYCSCSYTGRATVKSAYGDPLDFLFVAEYILRLPRYDWVHEVGFFSICLQYKTCFFFLVSFFLFFHKYVIK